MAGVTGTAPALSTGASAPPERRRSNWVPYALLLPGLLWLFVFFVVPMIIVNARTGSVVMNQSVRLGPVAVAHGSLSVTVSSTPVISQPSPLSQGGQTIVAEKADIRVQQDGGTLFNLAGGAELSEVVKSLNALGANAQDLIGILQALKAAGALKAELEII